jgi:hypothetical protein
VKSRTTSTQPPEPLLRYREDDWLGPSSELEYWDEIPGRPFIRWGNARRKWAREHVSTVEDFDRLLYGPDVVFPEETTQERDRNLTCALIGHPEWRRPKVFP